ncbi:DUF2079 domain-containing protein [Candidatus Roizmanbacteria bacterium]|nr:DUF2079 domain-containing protein [Candidatus Roizmanbacteria bacterium]
MKLIIRWWSGILLLAAITLYIGYFSYFSILRYQTLYASYYDLGIMHQTVFNTYKSIQTLDPSRFLELTNPLGADQIKRTAIHNDIFLAFMAPLYFIHSGPETLLIAQTIVLALGALAVYKIVLYEFGKNNYRYRRLLAFIFSLAYLLFTPMERANIFDFHAVTLSTSFLLWMFYFWLVKKYRASFLLFLLSLLTKEQIGLTTVIFGAYTLYYSFKKQKKLSFLKKYWFGSIIIFVSIVWSLLSFLFIIPYFRGNHHFAFNFYSDFGDSPISIIAGFFKKPATLIRYIFRTETYRYFLFILGPLGFLAILSPSLLIAAPEFAINLLSNNGNMQNIIYHYTAVIQPFVFIASIFGAYKIITRAENAREAGKRTLIISIIIFVCSLVFAYAKGPLPLAWEQEIHPLKYPQKEAPEASLWASALKSEKLKVSSTGQLAPFFTARQYFYLFSDRYVNADYVVLRLNEIYDYPEKNVLIPVYEQLKKK